MRSDYTYIVAGKKFILREAVDITARGIAA
jgi:hypothetical protein